MIYVFYILSNMFCGDKEGAHMLQSQNWNRLGHAKTLPLGPFWTFMESTGFPVFWQDPSSSFLMSWIFFSRSRFVRKPWWSPGTLVKKSCLYRDEQLPTYIDYKGITISRGKDPGTWSNQYNGMSVFKGRRFSPESVEENHVRQNKIRKFGQHWCALKVQHVLY